MYSGVTVVAMVLTIVLMWIVARAVIRLLRPLTDSAREISQTRLPQLVDASSSGGEVDTAELPRIAVNSEDEIGELATAFNDVEAVTMQVAREQSRLLRNGIAVNLFHGVFRHHPREVRDALAVPANLPVVLCDARNRLHVKETLVLLIEGALRRAQTADA
jgi:HAMP domain-containing protein